MRSVFRYELVVENAVQQAKHHIQGNVYYRIHQGHDPTNRYRVLGRIHDSRHSIFQYY